MTTNADKPFEPGEIVEWYGETFIVVSNSGDSGWVQSQGGGEVKFRWELEGEFVKRAESERQGE